LSCLDTPDLLQIFLKMAIGSQSNRNRHSTNISVSRFRSARALYGVLLAELTHVNKKRRTYFEMQRCRNILFFLYIFFYESQKLEN
jgi:hypothetical protein